MFSEEFEKIQLQAQERLEKQKDVPDTHDEDDANFAEHDGDVCDLRITFRGFINDENLVDFGQSDFNDEKFVYMNDGSTFWQALAGIQTNNEPAISYKWFCDFGDPLATFAWDAKTGNDLSPLDFAVGDEITSGETIRFKWFMESKLDGDRGFDFDGLGLNDPFQGSTTLPSGKPFPFDFQVSVKIEGITSDSYDMSYWSDENKINNENLGHRFHYDLCRDGISDCR